MEKFPDALDEIRVASPCPANWEEMRGDDRVRFCRHCRLHVYNFSAMSRKEALTLVNINEGKICVKFYRRKDGTVLTRDCPRGLRFAKRRLIRAVGAVLSAILSFTTWTTNATAAPAKHLSTDGKKVSKLSSKRKHSKIRHPHPTIGVIPPEYLRIQDLPSSMPAPLPLPTQIEPPPKPKNESS